ncbi:hypothetical protein LQ772_08520 [Frateuria edaphi]|uniref:hypothetical protein n=1 Tax=Frateuria edaphi TaxID=2898793 RepID=UPI001E58D6D5|nr:hypothetical protein [Frateuria edaphi]UGB47310.1 hypothetical protein LQ772_08520 [Frateuria edaphi]
MSPSLRLIARSRGLRALGLLAWLMLVLSSLTGAPFGMVQAHVATGSHARAMVAQPTHPGVAHLLSQDDCHHAHDRFCGGALGHACGCAGLCASAVPAMPASAMTALPATRAYAPPLQVRAPSTPRVPPLRPPLA